MLINLNAFSSVGWIIAFVSQYLKKSRRNAISYGKFF